MMIKTIILSPNAHTIFGQKTLQHLSKVTNLEIIGKPTPFSQIKSLKTAEEKIVAIDPDFCGWQVNKQDLSQFINTRAICLQTTAFDWIDANQATKQGITITNVRNCSTESVAEWAFMMALSCARKVPQIAKDGWTQDYDTHQGIELKGKTAAIIGLGHIGTRLAEICQGFGMQVIYWSKTSRDDRFAYAHLKKVFKTADVIFPTLAKNPKTQNLITDDMLKSMKSSALFISNISPLYNHQLLLKLVNNKKIGGYAFETEGGGVFHNHQGNIWAGPALAWVTKESWQNYAKAWEQSILDAAQNHFPTKIN